MEYDIANSPLMKLMLGGKPQRLPKGQVMQINDDRMLHVVNSGYVKRYLITNDGVHSVQTLYGPGDIFPLTPVYKAIFERNIYRGTEIIYYEALTAATVQSIDKATLAAAIAKDPVLYKDLLYVTGVRLGSNIQRLENLSLGSSLRRVAHLIAHYADKFGESSTKGVTIAVPMTHQDLASILNVARETVTNSLVRLRERGLVVVDAKHRILVPDIDKLKHAARH